MHHWSGKFALQQHIAAALRLATSLRRSDNISSSLTSLTHEGWKSKFRLSIDLCEKSPSASCHLCLLDCGTPSEQALLLCCAVDRRLCMLPQLSDSALFARALSHAKVCSHRLLKGPCRHIWASTFFAASASLGVRAGRRARREWLGISASCFGRTTRRPPPPAGAARGAGGARGVTSLVLVLLLVGAAKSFFLVEIQNVSGANRFNYL